MEEVGEERGAPFRFQPGPKTIQSPSLMSVDSRMLVQWREGKFPRGGVMSLGGWGWLVSFSRKRISGISIRRRSWRGRAMGGGEGGGAGEDRASGRTTSPGSESSGCRKTKMFFQKRRRS